MSRAGHRTRLGVAAIVVAGALGALGLWWRPSADPVTLFGIVVALTAVVVVACWIPARRAASIPSVQTLRGG